MTRIFVVALSLFLAGAVYGEEPKPVPPVNPLVTTPVTPTINAPVTTVVPHVNGPVAPVPPGATALPRPVTPMMNFPKPPNQEWIMMVDRLRIQPRAGEINNGTLTASLADIFSDSVETKTKMTAVSSEYEKALLEKAAKWESDIKELRAQYEAKIVAELPEAKREAAQKLLDMSRQKFAESSARDAKMRADFLERMRNGPRAGMRPGTPIGQGQGTPVAQPGTDANTWMREERMKGMKQDEESVKAMRELLSPEDAARFDMHNRSRPPMAPMRVAGPMALPTVKMLPPPTVPAPVSTRSVLPTVTAPVVTTPPPVAPVTPAAPAVETKK